MISINENCTGCMACYHVCPVSAISIGKNDYGFCIPVIDTEKCINCKACDSVCPKENSIRELNPLSAYYFKSKSKNVLQASSSGGAFHYLAKHILDNNGIVFGCAFDSQNRRFLCSNTDKVSLDELQRSKYVESSINNAYTEIIEQLDADRWVLFCGTPCQAAGLRAVLDKKYEKLVIVDFSCGGVPSQLFFFDYIKTLEKKYGSPISSVNFRDKFYKWGQYCISVTFENGRIYRKKAQADPYFYCFLHKNIKRASCVKCKFANNHYSDIILADFWKYEQITGKKGDTTGVSLILSQTDIGTKLINHLLQDSECECYEVDLEPSCYNIHERKNTDDDVRDTLNAHCYISKNGITRYYNSQVPLKIRLKWKIKQLANI